MFFLRFVLISSSLPSRLHCFFLCLLGNLAVVMRRSVAGDTRSGEECAKRAEGKGRGYSPERDLDAIFKSSTTSILSLLSLGLSRRLCSFARDPSRPKSAGYCNTALNRPRGLTLTWDHPLIRRRLPRMSCRRFPNLVSAFRRMGNFDEGEFRDWHEQGGIRVCLRSS